MRRVGSKFIVIQNETSFAKSIPSGEQSRPPSEAIRGGAGLLKYIILFPDWASNTQMQKVYQVPNTAHKKAVKVESQGTALAAPLLLP